MYFKLIESNDCTWAGFNENAKDRAKFTSTETPIETAPMTAYSKGFSLGYPEDFLRGGVYRLVVRSWD